MIYTAYLWVMVSIILLVALVSVPSLFSKKCPSCGARNRIEADQCRKCGEKLPAEDM